jgi:integrase
VDRRSARRFLAAARVNRRYAPFVIALALGLLRGELLGPRWSEVDLASRQLRVSQTLATRAWPGHRVRTTEVETVTTNVDYAVHRCRGVDLSPGSSGRGPAPG